MDFRLRYCSYIGLKLRYSKVESIYIINHHPNKGDVKKDTRKLRLKPSGYISLPSYQPGYQ
ncbi:hypothetical protein [Peribacillus sp. RS7]|uniref:hypothetical protein n=1 Tax=Peribacillus sp. RS7 TaxID=3242679 RepID=UPI0035C23FDD